MGVYCGDPLAGGFWWYDDYPFECQNTDGYTFVDNRYVCVSFVEHPGGSDNIAIDSTVVFTDFRWSNFEVRPENRMALPLNCVYTYLRSSTARSIG